RREVTCRGLRTVRQLWPPQKQRGRGGGREVRECPSPNADAHLRRGAACCAAAWQPTLVTKVQRTLGFLPDYFRNGSDRAEAGWRNARIAPVEIPPSTSSVCPVTYRLDSDARKTTAPSRSF